MLFDPPKAGVQRYAAAVHNYKPQWLGFEPLLCSGRALVDAPTTDLWHWQNALMTCFRPIHIDLVRCLNSMDEAVFVCFG